MLVARQGVADEDCVRRIGVERAIGFIGDLDRRQDATAIERKRPGQSDSAVEAETVIHPRRLAWCRRERLGAQPCRIRQQPKPWVMDIAPYVPGRATTDDGRKVAKLSSNENPLGTGAAARAAYERHVGDLDRYPDASATHLREAIGAHYGIEPAQIIHGTGSDEILHLAAGAFAGPGDEVIHVNYGFAVYEIATRRVGAVPVVAPDDDYGTNVDTDPVAGDAAHDDGVHRQPQQSDGHIRDSRTKLRGCTLDCRNRCCWCSIRPIPNISTRPMTMAGWNSPGRQPNVLVTRTFSKIFGLAAERIGWGYGHPDLIDAMHRIRAPFGVTSAGQAAAIAALEDTAFVAASKAHNDEWRTWFAAEIDRLGHAGLRAVPSKANFVLVTFEGAVSAGEAYQALMERGYIVRWLPGQGLGHGLRVTIGTEDEMRGLAHGAARDLVAG